MGESNEDYKRKQPKSTKEVLAVPRTDRRTLSYVPDPEQIRLNADRRGNRAERPGMICPALNI